MCRGKKAVLLTMHPSEKVTAQEELNRRSSCEYVAILPWHAKLGQLAGNLSKACGGLCWESRRTLARSSRAELQHGAVVGRAQPAQLQRHHRGARVRLWALGPVF